MKNIYFFLFLLIISFAAKAQDQTQQDLDPRDENFNELTVGALNLVAFGVLDISYERILNPYSSWAVEAFVVALDRDGAGSEAYEKDFSLTGKYKYFFQEKSARGFYVNGLAMVSTGEFRGNDDYYYNEWGELVFTAPKQRYTDLALGFGLGYKFVSRQGFVADLNSGVGRNLLNSDSPVIVGQVNFNLGFRF